MNVIRRWYSQAPATVISCFLIIAVYIVTAVQSRSIVANLDASSLADAWILFLPDMQGIGVFRALGAAFLHIGPAHLCLNLVLLFLFGREVETTWGSRVYALVFLTSAIGASAVTIWMQPLARTAGASGVGYALMALLVLIVARRGGDLRTPIVLIVLNLLYTFMTPTVSLWGHLGGLLFGILLALVLACFSRPTSRWAGLLIVLLLAVVAVVWRVQTFFSVPLVL